MPRSREGLAVWLCLLLAVAAFHRVSCTTENVLQHNQNLRKEADQVSLVQVEETSRAGSKEKLEPFSTAMLALTTASVLAKIAKTTVQAYDAYTTQEVSAFLDRLTTKTCRCLHEASQALTFSSSMVLPTLGRSGLPVERALLKMSAILQVKYSQCTSIGHHNDELLGELHTVPAFALASLALETIGLVEDFEHFQHAHKKVDWFAFTTENMVKKMKKKLHEAPEIALDLLAEPDELVHEFFSTAKSIVFAVNPITHIMHKTVKAYSSWASLFTTSAAYVKRAQHNAVRRIDVVKDVENNHCRTLANQVLVLVNMLDEAKKDRETGSAAGFFQGRVPTSVDYNSCLTYVVDAALRDSLDARARYTDEAKEWCSWVLSRDIVWYTPLIKTMLGMIESLEKCDWVSRRPRYYGAVHPGGRDRPVVAVLLDDSPSVNKYAMVDISIVKASSKESLLEEVSSLTAKEFGVTYRARDGDIHFTTNPNDIVEFLVPRLNMCSSESGKYVLVMWRQAMSKIGRVVGSPITAIDFVSDLERLEDYVTVDVDLTCGRMDSSGHPLYLAYKKLGATALITDGVKERILAAKEGGVSLISSQVSEANAKLDEIRLEKERQKQKDGTVFTPLSRDAGASRLPARRPIARPEERPKPNWNDILSDTDWMGNRRRKE